MNPSDYVYSTVRKHPFLVCTRNHAEVQIDLENSRNETHYTCYCTLPADVFARRERGQQGKKDIVETAVAAGNFKTLAAALQAAGLVDTLKGAGPFTVFAPTDEAFAKLPAGTVDELLKPENHDKLVAILTYHVVSGKVMAKDVMKLHEAKTVNGKDVKIMAEGGKVMVDNANVVKTDIVCSNGVIHVIDSVILPQ